MTRLVVWLIALVLRRRLPKKDKRLVQRYSRRYWNNVDGLIKFGLWATILFLLLVFLFSLDDTCGLWTCETRWKAFADAPANEVGDSLAGLAGGLAFLWLIVTVMLQGKELAAQRKELQLTRRESAKMARAMDGQLDLLVYAQKLRNQEIAERTLESRLNDLSRLFDECIHNSSFCRWFLFNGRLDQNGQISRFDYRNPDSFITEVAAKLRQRFRGFDALDKGQVEFDYVLFQGEANIARLKDCSKSAESILNLKSRLSEDQKIRVETLEIAKLQEMIDAIIGNPSNYTYDSEPDHEFNFQ